MNPTELLKELAIKIYKDCTDAKLDFLAIDYLDPEVLRKHRNLFLDDLMEVTNEELVDLFKMSRELYKLGKRLANGS